MKIDASGIASRTDDKLKNDINNFLTDFIQI